MDLSLMVATYNNNNWVLKVIYSARLSLVQKKKEKSLLAAYAWWTNFDKAISRHNDFFSQQQLAAFIQD